MKSFNLHYCENLTEMCVALFQLADVFWVCRGSRLFLVIASEVR